MAIITSRRHQLEHARTNQYRLLQLHEHRFLNEEKKEKRGYNHLE